MTRKQAILAHAEALAKQSVTRYNYKDSWTEYEMRTFQVEAARWQFEQSQKLISELQDELENEKKNLASVYAYHVELNEKLKIAGEALREYGQHKRNSCIGYLNSDDCPCGLNNTIAQIKGSKE